LPTAFYIGRLVNSLEVRWLGGQTNFYDNLDANTTWEITEGEPTPKRFIAHAMHAPPAATTSAPGGLNPAAQAQAGASSSDKAKVLEFWENLRTAMNAMKIEKAYPKAIRLFRAALTLDPKHEDARYYLGQCLASEGNMPGALEQFEELTYLNPHSHRGFQQWGVARACSATSAADLVAAE
jgi:TolA-binding protein